MRHWTDEIHGDYLRSMLMGLRTIASRPMRESVVWDAVKTLFSVGSTTAIRICERAGVDPEAPLGKVRQDIDTRKRKP